MRYLSLLVTIACTNGVVDVKEEPIVDPVIDQDGDGYYADEDCDDANSNINPSAVEVCDGVDNNCDESIDEEVKETFYLDSDEDGFGDSSIDVESCEAPEGYVSNGNDCDDANSSTYPGAPEQCDDLDNDCDESIDEDLIERWYLDDDDDGFGALEHWVDTCQPDSNYVIDNTDCNDEDPDIHPVAIEVCDRIDNDCNGSIDEGLLTTFFVDADEDGYGDEASTVEECEEANGWSSLGGDCDDIDPQINPLANEECDGYDNNCNGIIDEDTAIDASLWHEDFDLDGYGNTAISLLQCYQPTGYVLDDTDCDDTDSTVSPNSSEICDGLVNTCGGTLPANEIDNDGDGYVECSVDINGWDGVSGLQGGDDCDDNNSIIYPTAQERCDGIINDCITSVLSTDEIDDDGDGYVDCIIDPNGWNGSVITGGEDCDDGDPAEYPGVMWYSDADGDGFGNTANVSSCEQNQPTDVLDDTDCLDSNDTIHPGAQERCDGIINDCITSVLSTDEIDNDGDGYVECSVDSNGWDGVSITGGDDCDDNNSIIYPTAQERCDGIINDCITSVLSTDEIDDDGDGYVDCIIDPNGWNGSVITGGEDCDDGDTSQYPGADEYCTGEDDNCDGTIDENTALDAGMWYLDSDIDTYGDSNTSTISCNQPTGYVVDDTDCNDSESTIHPGATEQCDGLDNDCNSVIDDGAGQSGFNSACPAEDCQEIYNNGTTADGNYWIDPDGFGAFEIFCDMTNEGGGWTLVANVDDIHDSYFGALQSAPWESNSVRNETVFPSHSTDISVSSKYTSWSTINVTDLYIVYKNTGNHFLCEGLSINSPLHEIFSLTPSSGTCSATCSSFSEDIMPEPTNNPVGLNCSDANEGWLGSSGAENSRIGGESAIHGCCVTNAWLGAAGDRGYSTNILEKTWGAYSSGVIEDNNIMVFVR